MMNGNLFQRIGKSVVSKRGTSFIFMILALACAIGMLITYSVTGISTFTPVLSGKVITLMWVSIILCALLSVFEVKICKYAVYLVGLFTWMEYLASEMSYISNVVVGIDGNSFGTGFILTVGFGLLSWVFALISAITQKEEIGSAKAAVQEGADHE